MGETLAVVRHFSPVSLPLQRKSAPPHTRYTHALGLIIPGAIPNCVKPTLAPSSFRRTQREAIYAPLSPPFHPGDDAPFRPPDLSRMKRQTSDLRESGLGGTWSRYLAGVGSRPRASQGPRYVGTPSTMSPSQCCVHPVTVVHWLFDAIPPLSHLLAAAAEGTEATTA
jgi:hypothetical protein